MTIQAVDRALDIIGLFANSRPSLSLTQISAALELNKSTAYGLISSLEKKGFLKKKPETKQYRLGIRVYELGIAFSSSLEINRMSVGPTQALAEKTQQTPRVAIMEGDFAFVTLFALPGAQTNIASQVGPRLPLYCTAMGKAILAFQDADFINSYIQRTKLIRHTEYTIIDPDRLRKELRKITKSGFSVSRGEFVKGQLGIAVPIHGYENKLVGGLAISGRDPNLLGEKMNWYTEEIFSTARDISMSMGYSPLRS